MTKEIKEIGVESKISDLQSLEDETFQIESLEEIGLDTPALVSTSSTTSSTTACG